MFAFLCVFNWFYKTVDLANVLLEQHNHQMTLVNQEFHYDNEPSIADYHHLISFCLYLLLQTYLTNTAASKYTLIITTVNNSNKSPANGRTSHYYGDVK